MLCDVVCYDVVLSVRKMHQTLGVKFSEVWTQHLPSVHVSGTSGTTTFLRFWRCADAATSSSTGAAPSFVLQTTVEAPHGSSKVKTHGKCAQARQAADTIGLNKARLFLSDILDGDSMQCS